MAVDGHINPATGVWDDNYWATHGGASTGSSGSSSGGNTGNIASNAQDLLKMYQQANAPVVSQLQSTIPTIQQGFQQAGQFLQKQASNLDTRYQSLLDSIKGAQQTDVRNVTNTTSQELGRRGISAESGVFGQSIDKALLPVNTGYAQQVGQTGADWQAAQANVQNLIAQNPIQQTQAEQQVQQAIAQLQAGGNSSAITGALGLYQQQQAQENAAKVAGIQANPNYVPIPGYGAINQQSGQVVNALSNSGASGGIQYINGQPYVYVPDNGSSNAKSAQQVLQGRFNSNVA